MIELVGRSFVTFIVFGIAIKPIKLMRSVNMTPVYSSNSQKFVTLPIQNGL
jgi:hypothetical protein